MRLNEFLLARIAEDEDAAQGATPGRWERDGGWSITAPAPEGWDGPYMVVETKQRNDAEHVARHDPVRVLAECEAKRRIVVEHPPFAGHCDTCHELDGPDMFPCRTLRALTLPYAEHPDYLPEWKVDP